jgi:hypothetical protein
VIIMEVSRRHFLQTSAAVSLGFSGMHQLFARQAFATPNSATIVEGFGKLHQDPAGILELPEGFSYKIISRWQDEMDDGFLVPARADGMATFPGPDGLTLIIRNHEISAEDKELGPYGANHERLDKVDAGKVYDWGQGEQPAIGGTSTMLYDTRTGELHKQFLSLAGTERNCAGGPTPWNTWISCEEDTTPAGGTYEKDHGYCFEVPADAESGLVNPVPLMEMGRFNHEAIAVDPKSGIVYLTEDRKDGLLYRFLPNVPGKLAEGGRLQALGRQGVGAYDTRNWGEGVPAKIGKGFPVTWIDVEDVTSPKDDLRFQGYDRGAARFARGEGMWYGDGTIYFACTNGGAAYKGQIWKYTPSPEEGTALETFNPGSLELFVEPNDGGIIDNADNITVSPWGDLVVCEDGSGEQFLVGITPEGGIYKFARNAMASNSEFAGATFSPDGTTLFVNIQTDGLTLAITGPWKNCTA